MQLTPEYLKEELKSLQTQHANALAVAQQAIGAISLIESLLKAMETKDAMTLDELREGLGAVSAEIVEANPGASAPGVSGELQ